VVVLCLLAGCADSLIAAGVGLALAFALIWGALR
jgi:hypothetical protein